MYIMYIMYKLWTFLRNFIGMNLLLIKSSQKYYYYRRPIRDPSETDMPDRDPSETSTCFIEDRHA